jgi:hypothetical protein
MDAGMIEEEMLVHIPYGGVRILQAALHQPPAIEAIECSNFAEEGVGLPRRTASPAGQAARIRPSLAVAKPQKYHKAVATTKQLTYLRLE